MDKSIDLKKSVYEICREYPEVIGIMKELGFENIVAPGMLNTAGRFMTILKGSEMKRIDMQHIIQVFRDKGYSVNE